MKKNIGFILALLGWFSCFLTFDLLAQTHDPKALKWLEEAKTHIRNRSFDPAFDLLNKAIRKDSTLSEAYLVLGNIQKLFGHEAQAFEVWRRYVRQKPHSQEAANLYYTLGVYALRSGNYAISQTYLESYIVAIKNGKTAQTDTNIARRYLNSAIFAFCDTQNTIGFAPPRLLPRHINNKVLQYFPSLTSDENTMLFTAADGLKRNQNEDLWLAHRRDGQWLAAQPLPDNINTQDNEGACFISGDGRTLVFSGCERPDGIGRCDLYVCYLQENKWSNPQNMKSINSPHWDSQPSLSADGRTIYFVSDRPGGAGKSDIWFATLDDKKQWSSPQNLGPIINTAAAEYAPSLHANGTTLFFSSDGHPGYGNQDIFVSTLKATGWSKALNLGKKVNSFEDETGFCLSADGKTAYVSLQRNDESGRLASAMLANIEPDLAWKPESPAFYLQVISRQITTQKPLGAQIELRESNTGKLIYQVLADASTGQSLMTLPGTGNYSLFVSYKNHTFFSQNFVIKPTSSIANLLVAELSPIIAGAQISLENILFESGKHELSKQSLAELDKIHLFMNQNQKIKIRIEAHTDDEGSGAENLALSQARAAEVVSWLAKKGIDPKRMSRKGFGETKKTSDNLTQAGRQKNRRVELIIL